MSSLLNTILIVSKLKHLTSKHYSLPIFKNMVYHFCTFKIDGDIGKFVQCPNLVNWSRGLNLPETGF